MGDQTRPDVHTPPPGPRSRALLERGPLTLNQVRQATQKMAWLHAVVTEYRERREENTTPARGQ